MWARESFRYAREIFRWAPKMFFFSLSFPFRGFVYLCFIIKKENCVESVCFWCCSSWLSVWNFWGKFFTYFRYFTSLCLLNITRLCSQGDKVSYALLKTNSKKDKPNHTASKHSFGHPLSLPPFNPNVQNYATKPSLLWISYIYVLLWNFLSTYFKYSFRHACATILFAHFKVWPTHIKTYKHKTK